jgi:ABC-type lipoprotein export system ATPase subunit
VTAVDVRDLFRVHRTEEGDAAALQGLTLQVAAGEIVTVLGPSGSGKSTLLRSLAALEPPSAGIVLVFGRDVGRMAAQEASRYRAAEVGIVDQHYDRALSPDLSCEQIVALQPALLGIPKRERHARAGELLARVGLAGAAGSRPDRLSGGERQRVAVCAALAHRPRLLLADEPSGELDAASAAGVYALIRELAHEAGTTVVLVSHDPGSVEIADRAVRIRDGRVAEEVRRDGREWAVIGHGGWVRIPPAMLAEGGFADHARIEPGHGALVLRPEGGGAPGALAPPAAAVAAAAGAGRAAQLHNV